MIMKKLKQLFSTLKYRWVTESPIFWKNVLNLMTKLGISATAILGAEKGFDLQDTYHVPAIIFTVCGYIIVACAGMGLTAKLTIKDNPN